MSTDLKDYDVEVDTGPEPVEEPIFEVVIPSSLAVVHQPLHHFKFYANGRIEGFEGLGGGIPRVTNRLPLMLDYGVVAPLSEYIATLQDYVDGVRAGNDMLAAGPPPAKAKQQ